LFQFFLRFAKFLFVLFALRDIGGNDEGPAIRKSVIVDPDPAPVVTAHLVGDFSLFEKGDAVFDPFVDLVFRPIVEAPLAKGLEYFLEGDAGLQDVFDKLEVLRVGLVEVDQPILGIINRRTVLNAVDYTGQEVG